MRERFLLLFPEIDQARTAVDGFVPCAENSSYLVLFRKRRKHNFQLLVGSYVEVLQSKPALPTKDVLSTNRGICKFGEILGYHLRLVRARKNDVYAVCAVVLLCDDASRSRRT